MLLCRVCWENTCTCHANKVEIDDEISDIVRILNLNGYETCFSCAGHIRADEIKIGIVPTIYIAFNKYRCGEIVPDDIGEGWRFFKTSYILKYQLMEAIRFMSYSGPNKKWIKKRNKLLTPGDIDKLEYKLSKKRNELRKFAEGIGA